MDLKTIRSELRRLTALVEGWEDRASGPMPALERDLVLEKLRSLYDAVRFAAGEPDAVRAAGHDANTATGPDAEPAAADEDEAADSVAIDLGAVLSLDSMSAGEAEAVSEVTLVAEPDAMTVQSVTTKSEADTAQPTPVGEPEPEAAQPTPVGEPEPDTAQPAPVAESPAVLPSEPEPAVAPASGTASAPVSAPETVSAFAPAPESASESASGPAPDRKPQYVAPTLFGLEEETVRHRHKQRVIMSLYDTPAERPMPAERPARPEPARQEANPPSPAVSQASAPAGPDAYPESAARPEPPAKPESAATPQPAEAPQPVGPEDPIVPGPAAEPDVAIAANPAAEPAEQPVSATTLAEPEAPEIFEITEISEPETPEPSEPHLSAQYAAPEFVPSPEVPAETLDSEEEPEPEAEDIPFATTPSTPLAPSTVDSAPAGAVLGEVINHDVQTLGDVIARPRDMASELRRSEPVEDLRKAIGINDKFLLIRDLFGGDGAAYDEAIAALNAFDDLDECMIHIAENYAWNPNSDGAKLIMELLERKFS